jgi:hypothetical protein
LWAVHFTLDRQCDRQWLYQTPVEGTQEGEKDMAERAGTRRNGVKAHATKRHCAIQPGSFIAGVRRAQASAQPERLLQARELRLGWKPAGLKGPGRDSRAGSVRSMTARPDARCWPEKILVIMPPRKENYFFLLASAISAY